MNTRLAVESVSSVTKLDYFGYVMAFGVALSYFGSSTMFAWGNVVTFIPLSLVAYKHRAYPNLCISLFFGLVAITKLVKA